MDNTALKNSGPGGLADRARMGADIAGNLGDASLPDIGPDRVADMVRMGAPVLDPRISAVPVLEGTDGEEYEGFTAWVDGGSPPYSFELVGTWPEGLTIDADTGEVSGTPSEGGTFAGLSVKATDANSKETETGAFSVVIAEAEGG